MVNRDIENICLHEANDIVMVLGGTFRAISMDDFQDYCDGVVRDTKHLAGKKVSGVSGDEISLPAFMQMVKGMSFGGKK